MNTPLKRFKAAFVSNVDFYDNRIELIDCNNSTFVVDLRNENVVNQFKSWFETIYKNCIPQTLTLFEYELVNKNEYDIVYMVKNIIFNASKGIK